jgi:hypothetical protein
MVEGSGLLGDGLRVLLQMEIRINLYETGTPAGKGAAPSALAPLRTKRVAMPAAAETAI